MTTTDDDRRTVSKTILPERFEIRIVHKWRYINTLSFLSFPFLSLASYGEYADETDGQT